MSSPGSGIGGSLGSPQLPPYPQTEGFSEVNQARMGIVHDSLLQENFISRNQNKKSGSDYSASPGQPSLGKLENSRIAKQPDITDDSWKDLYTQLAQSLPDIPAGEGVKSKYDAEMALPYEQRNGTYVAVDHSLELTAKVLTYLESAAAPTSIDDPANQRTLSNLTRPLVALQFLIDQKLSLTQSINERLSDIGPNSQHYDTLKNLSGQLEQAYEGLGQLFDLMKQDPNGEVTQQYASDLAELLGKMNTGVQNTFTGDSLTFIKSQFEAVTLLATALAVRDTSVPLLYIGLKIATTPSQNPDNPSLPGNALTAIFTKLVQGLGPLSPGMDASHQDLLAVLTTAGMGTFIGLANQLADPGYGQFPSNDPAYLAEAREFSFDSALFIMRGLGVVEGFFAAALEGAGVASPAAEKLNQILTGTAYLLMIFSGGQSLSEPALERVLSSHSDQILKSFEPLEEYLNNLEYDASHDTVQALAIAVQQARMALKDGDISGFYDALVDLTELSGTTTDQVTRDMEETNKATGNLFYASTHRDDQLTEMISVA